MSRQNVGTWRATSEPCVNVCFPRRGTPRPYICPVMRRVTRPVIRQHIRPGNASCHLSDNASFHSSGIGTAQPLPANFVTRKIINIFTSINQTLHL
ncbi:MAG: hypothetical protein HDS84_00955 [Bacteroidales bacterium]|nr:hypothetical protein [Bacteroidales bacterium]MBD5302935.1 hypothetical protein [Bacteroides sp.]